MGWLPFLLTGLLALIPLSASAQDVTSDPDGNQFAMSGVRELPPIYIYACARGKYPCIEHHAEEGCVAAQPGTQAFKRVCSQLAAQRSRYQFECKVIDRTRSVIVGMTLDEDHCDAIRTLWQETWEDPFLSERFLSSDARVAFFRDTLLRGNKRREDPGIRDHLQSNSRRAYRPNQNLDEVRNRIRKNRDAYLSESSCGPGIIPGIDRTPILDQRGQGTCYAHAAATMIDYVRLRYHSGRARSYTSPLMAAIDYHMASNATISSCSDPMASGFTVTAFNRAMDRGFCDSRDIEVAIRKNFENPSRFRSAKWYLDWSKDYFKDMANHPFRVDHDDKVLAFLYAVGEFYKRKDWASLRRLHYQLRFPAPENACSVAPQDPVPEVEDLAFAAIAASPNLEEFYQAFFDGICQRTAIEPRAVAKDDVAPANLSIAKLDASIESKKLPIGVNYCSKILKAKGWRAAKSPITADEDCGPHASVLIGTSRDKQGRCAYVVRNSWGTDCSPYDRDYECRDGNILIPKEDLVANLYSRVDITIQGQ